MKNYLEMRAQCKAEYLRVHSVPFTFGLVHTWGPIKDESTFDKIHACCVQAIRDHVVAGNPLEWNHPYREWVEGGTEIRISPDEVQIMELIVTAVLTLAIVILCPILGIVAGVLAQAILIGIKMVIGLILAGMAIEFITGLYGDSPEAHNSQVGKWASESLAA
jgi:hypothetical protein